MTYAQGRTFYDADSHIMELPDFLIEHADPQFRDAMPKIRVEAPRLQAALGEAVATKAHSAERVAELVAMGDQLISGPKGYLALGAFNRDEDQPGHDARTKLIHQHLLRRTGRPRQERRHIGTETSGGNDRAAAEQSGDPKRDNDKPGTDHL